MPPINFTERGTGGQVVVLIHGFPFNQKIWDDFAGRLSKSFKVLTPDLPGLGASQPLPSPVHLQTVAGALWTWLDGLQIKNAVVIGHSLGGYVALAMTSLRPDQVSKLVLFHSTAYPDSEEKKANRNKVVEFIGKNGVLAFTSNFITSLFSNPDDPAIAAVRGIATEATENVVVQYTLAMRDRPDMTGLLREFHKPVMIITGEKDQGISVDSVKKQAELSKKSIELHILPEAAHMGMFEKRDETLELIRNFITGSNRQ
jgi:pimeloyl-ACP methyl ester carboxylesterase